MLKSLFRKRKSNFGQRYSWKLVSNFITNNTAKIHLHILGRTFWLTSGAIVNFKGNVIYRPNCFCGSFYIGQTLRNLMKRLQEHQISDTLEVCNHIQSNTHHKVDFNNSQSLTHSPDKYKLLILESLFIELL